MAALRYPELTLTLQGDLRLDEIDTRIAAVGTAIVAASGDEDTGGLAAHRTCSKSSNCWLSQTSYSTRRSTTTRSMHIKLP